MTQERMALIATVSIWAVFFIFVLLLPVPEVEEKITFGEMSIRLEPLPQQVQQESLQQNTQESRQQEETTARTPVLEAQPQKSEAQTIESPTVNSSAVQENTVREAPAPRREQVLQKSMEELMAEQNNQRTVGTEPKWSDDMFKTAAQTNTSVQSQDSAERVQPRSNLDGSAASFSSDSSSVSAQGLNLNKATDNGVVSNETNNLLDGIANAEPGRQGAFENDTNSERSSPTTDLSNTSGYNISFDGEPRKLIFPKDPKLDISKENERLIDNSRTVQISFTVSQNGTVQPSSINFSPSSLVPVEIQSELRQQIASWRFQEGQGSGKAMFDYDIKVE